MLTVLRRCLSLFDIPSTSDFIFFSNTIRRRIFSASFRSAILFSFADNRPSIYASLIFLKNPRRSVLSPDEISEDIIKRPGGGDPFPNKQIARISLIIKKRITGVVDPILIRMEHCALVWGVTKTSSKSQYAIDESYLLYYITFRYWQ